MPVIPYRPGQVENAPLPASRFSANATGADFGGQDAANLGDVAAGLARVGNSATAIAADEQERLNRSLVRDALSSARSSVRDYLTNQVYTRHGLDAVNVQPEVEKQFKQIQDGQIERLQNGSQKELFRQMFTDVQDEHLAHVQGFQQQQREVYEKASIDASNFNSVQDSILMRSNPAVIKKNEEDIVFNTAYKFRGLGKDVQKAETAKAISNLHTEIVSSIGKDDARAGLAYLEANKGKFLPETYSIEKSRLEAQGISEAAFQRAASAYSQGMSVKQAQEYADKNISNPKEAELFVSGVQTRIAQATADQKVKERTATEDAWQQVIKSPNAPIPTNLPADEQIKMQEYKTKVAKQATGEQQANAYGKLLALSDQDFVNTNLFQYRADLSEHDFNYLATLQTKMRKGGDEETKNFRQAKGDAEKLMEQIPFFDISEKAGKNQEANAYRRQQFLASVTDKLRTLPDEKRDHKAVKAITDDLMKDVVINQGHWYNALTLGLSGPVRDQTVKQFEYDQTQDQPTPIESRGSASAPAAPDFGNRADGTKKGNGFLGVLQRPDGGVSTEISVGVNLDGKETEVPLLVPTLNKNEVDTLLSLPPGQKPPPEIVQKAVDHAKERIALGKSPFASNDETVRPVQKVSTPGERADLALKSRLGLNESGNPAGSLEITGADIKASAKQVLADLATSGRWVGSIPGKILNPIGEAIGADYANAFPNKSEMEFAQKLHILLQDAGVDTKEADDAFKKMNGISVPDANAPGGMTLGGSNTPRGYITEVNKLADTHSEQIAKRLNLERVRAVDDLKSIPPGTPFIWKPTGQLLIKK